jgi:hypothetical protein
MVCAKKPEGKGNRTIDVVASSFGFYDFFDGKTKSNVIFMKVLFSEENPKAIVKSN